MPCLELWDKKLLEEISQRERSEAQGHWPGRPSGDGTWERTLGILPVPLASWSPGPTPLGPPWEGLLFKESLALWLVAFEQLGPLLYHL